MLVELGLVEQRYAAVREVLEGASVTEVARRNGVARQTVHDWLRKYAAGGMAALVDRSSKPLSCAHQMPPEVEARIVELRRPLAGPQFGASGAATPWADRAGRAPPAAGQPPALRRLESHVRLPAEPAIP